MKLTDLLSRKEVAELLGTTPYKVKQLGVDGHMTGIPVGAVPGNRSTAATVYTRRQVQAYQKRKGGANPTAGEIKQIMDVDAVAELTGISVTAVRKQAFSRDTLPSRTVGGVRLFLRRDVEAFMARRARILAEMDAPRVDVVDGRVADFDVATAVADFRQARGMSQEALADLVDAGMPDGGMSQFRQVISKIERRQPVRVREDVYGRLVAVLQGE